MNSRGPRCEPWVLPADIGGAGVGGLRGPADVLRAGRLVVVVGRGAAGTAAGDAVVHVPHGRVARGEVRREVA